MPEELITYDETIEEILRFFGRDRASLMLSCPGGEMAAYFYPIYRSGVEAVLNKLLEIYSPSKCPECGHDLNREYPK